MLTCSGRLSSNTNISIDCATLFLLASLAVPLTGRARCLPEPVESSAARRHLNSRAVADSKCCCWQFDSLCAPLRSRRSNCKRSQKNRFSLSIFFARLLIGRRLQLLLLAGQLGNGNTLVTCRQRRQVFVPHVRRRPAECGPTSRGHLRCAILALAASSPNTRQRLLLVLSRFSFALLPLYLCLRDHRKRL